MKKFGLLILFLLLTFPFIKAQVAPTQGDVVINTFDTRYGGVAGTELVVLVNRTNSTIDLNGFELRSFAVSGNLSGFSVVWNTQTIMLPYSFLLIATVSPINGADADFIATLGGWADDGYVALRKQSPTVPSEYIDIVKHSDGTATFSGVPANSGLLTTDPTVAINPTTNLATRGGVAGNLGSLVYTGYNVAANFTVQTEVGTALQNSFTTPLPVELTSFSVAVIGKDVKLSWNTATEINNFGFEVERMSNVKGQTSDEWQKIGFVNGNGNSNSPKNYSFVDDKVSAGKYSYRLKQIDNDGHYEYSKTIEVDVNGVKEYTLTQNYPNPFNPTTTIQYILPQAGNVKLTLYNILGQQIRTLVNELKEAGTHTINIDASDLNSGMYIYKIESGSFVQTRKMTLVK